uniref:Kazal-like domain-containing protein n=1 Tax=Strigamia maritima TaxID=126957 RepID=T1JHP9_STRMM
MTSTVRVLQIFTVFAMISIIFACGGNQQFNCQTNCPSVFSPVCGTDGRMYSNRCQLNVANCQSNGRIRLDPTRACCRYNNCGEIFAKMAAPYDLKREEEVQEYLENLGIEYRFSCYKEKNSEGCHLLADYMEAVKKDFPKAAAVYKLNCDERSYGKSCYKYGAYTLIGKGNTQQNFVEALKYLSKGCENGSPQGCLGAGVLLQAPELLQHRDHKKSISNFERGCAAGDPKCCFHASGLYIRGFKDVIPVNFKKAFECALKGCELGHPHACNNVSQMYSRGDGVEKNEELAAKYKKQAVEIREQIVMFSLLLLSVCTVKRCPDVCYQLFDPVCDTNGKQYGNKCFFRIAACRDKNIRYDRKGACLQPKAAPKVCSSICIALYKPVCDTNGNRYENDCRLSIAKCHDKRVVYDSTGACLDTILQ